MTENEDRWQERLDDARRLYEGLASRPGTPRLIERLAAYAEDPKWEVRKIVAEAMLYMPQDAQFRFAGLRNDPTSYVKRAAENALARSGVAVCNDGERERLMLANSQKIDNLLVKAGARSNAALENAFRAQYALTIGSVGHEIRNLLSPLMSSLETSLKLLEPPTSQVEEDVVRYLKVGLERAKAMEAMADDIRALVKKTNEKKCHENLSALLHKSLQSVRELFESRNAPIGGIAAEVVVEDTMTCYVAREAIMHAFRNLIKNAFEAFMTGENTFEESGRIVIKATHIDGGVQVDFIDNGQGMNKAELDLVRRFTANGTSKKASGTGFGLAIACRKVRDHNGSITIDSEEEVGTTVSVFLPDKKE